MAIRLISAAVGLPLLLVIMLLCPLWAFALLVGAICALAAFEFIRCTVPKADKRIYASVVLAAVAPMSCLLPWGDALELAALYLLTVLMLWELIRSLTKEKPLPLSEIALVIMGAGVMPFLLSSLVRIGSGRENYRIYILLPFVISFINDSAAYFVGRGMGKKKLIPKVSPNKTVAGAVGGAVFSVAFTLLYGFILSKTGLCAAVNYLALAVYGLLGSAAGQLGDLSFSAVKRVCKIKDFGNLIPGHGGALDRFDSMFFVAPIVELCLLIFPAL